MFAAEAPNRLKGWLPGKHGFPGSPSYIIDFRFACRRGGGCFMFAPFAEWEDGCVFVDAVAV